MIDAMKNRNIKKNKAFTGVSSSGYAFGEYSDISFSLEAIIHATNVHIAAHISH